MDTRQKQIIKISQWGLLALAGGTAAVSLDEIVYYCTISNEQSNAITSFMIFLFVVILLLSILLLAAGRYKPNLGGKNTIETVLGGALSATLLVLSIVLLVLGGMIKATGEDLLDHTRNSTECVASPYLQPINHVYAIMSEECPDMMMGPV